MLLLPFCNLLNVRAEGTTIDADDTNKVVNTAELIVNSGNATDSFRAYKVVDAFYDSGTNQMSYKFTTEFAEFLKSSGDDNLTNLTIDKYMSYGTDNQYNVSSEFKNLADKFAKGIKNGNYSFKTYDLTYSDSSASASVEVGSYLVLPTDINEYLLEDRFKTINNYSVLIANVIFTVDSGSWVLNDCAVYSKETSNFLDPYFIKTDVANFPNYDFSSDNIYNDLEFVKGEKYLFLVTASEPRIKPNDPIWKLEINIPDGLTFGLDDVYYLDGEFLHISDGKLVDSDGNIEGNIAVEGQKITITSIDVTDLLSIAVEVTLAGDDKIVVGSTGNVINTKLTYESDQYTDPASVGYFELQNKAITYGLEITNKNNNNTYLTDGVFGIYTDEACTDANKIGEVTIDQGDDTKKYGRYIGLSSGTYYVKQLKAASGYKLSNDVAKISIDSTVSNYFSLDVINDKMGLLPSTGGLGTIFYTLIGLIVIGIGSYAVVKYSKKQINS